MRIASIDLASYNRASLPRYMPIMPRALARITAATTGIDVEIVYRDDAGAVVRSERHTIPASPGDIWLLADTLQDVLEPPTGNPTDIGDQTAEYAHILADITGCDVPARTVHHA